ncbi:hypothetical protein BH23ACT11_BH23ACT11_01910 [soil metagenome]
MRSQSDTSMRMSPDNIAEILLSEDAVSEERMQDALSKQRGNGESLGQVLVSEGYVEAEELARILSRHLNMKYVVLSEEEVDPDLIGIVGEETLKECEAIPLRIEDGKLVVAMSDPADNAARSRVVESAGRPIVPVAAAEDAIRVTRERLLESPTDEEESAADGGGEDNEQQSSSFNGKRTRGRVGGGRVGDILVAEGKISEEQLQEALDLRKHDSRNLGEILISLGLVEPADLAQALAQRLRLDYVVLTELTPDGTDSEAINLMDEKTCRKYKALPLRFEDDQLIVAMSDPNDLYALEDLRIIAKKRVTPVVVSEEDLNGALDHLFGSDEESYEESDETYSEVEASGEYAEPEVAMVDEPEPLGADDYEEADGDSEADHTPLAGDAGDEASHENGSEEATDLHREEELPEEIVEDAVEEVAEGAPGGEAAEAEPRQRRTLAGSARIGDALVEQGKITDEQLQQAISAQKDDPKPIGEILISLGYVSEADLAEAQARRLKMEYIELTDTDVDRGLPTLIDQKVLRRHGAVPLRMQEGRLAVAMSDPKDIHALEDLRMISGYPVTPVVATQSDIQRVQNKLFALGEGVSEFLEESAEDPSARDEGEVDLGADADSDEAPIIRLVSSILQQAVAEGASDIHIEP